eukprot:1160601-Pelagomonas_calceolata.AAC.7
MEGLRAEARDRCSRFDKSGSSTGKCLAESKPLLLRAFESVRQTSVLKAAVHLFSAPLFNCSVPHSSIIMCPVEARLQGQELLAYSWMPTTCGIVETVTCCAIAEDTYRR